MAPPRVIAIGAILLLNVVCAQAQQFSAELERTMTPDGQVASAGRLYVQGARVRIETPEFADGFFVVDGTRNSALFVRPTARVYMAARQSSWLTRMLITVSAEDPCEQWHGAAVAAGSTDRSADWHCEAIGQEMIGGHETRVFRAQIAHDKEFVGWVDPTLHFPVRIRRDDTTIDLRDIREAMQPDQLFDVPPSFKRFDPEELIKRIKQSDVWVENLLRPPGRSMVSRTGVLRTWRLPQSTHQFRTRNNVSKAPRAAPNAAKQRKIKGSLP